MQNTPTIEIDKEKAKEVYQEYLEAVKTRKEEYLEQLKKVYHALSKGQKVIDVYEVFKQSGVNDKGEPKLAIVRADARLCVFRKNGNGSGMFSARIGKNNILPQTRYNVELAEGTFSPFEEDKTKSWWDDERFTRRNISSPVPVCPPHLLPNSPLDRYHVLFEVKEWAEAKQMAGAGRDPFLLRRINRNTFIVLAEWDLTEVEQAVIRGL